MTMYRVQSPGAYLVKDGKQQVIGQEKKYKAEEINGWEGPAARVVVTNMDTGEHTAYFPGQPIMVEVPKKKKKKSKKDK